MKENVLAGMLSGALMLLAADMSAQYRTDAGGGTDPADSQDSTAMELLSAADSADAPVYITLEDALKIALSENISVQVADKEIERTGYAKKGTYSSLFPQIDISGTYQRTIKKQVMYMDFDMGDMAGAMGGGSESGAEGEGAAINMDEGLEVGRWNTWAAGVQATMPLVNAQLWKSLKISGLDVELAVEKARSSRLDMVTSVKNAYYSVLLAKEAFDVYREVYENAVKNYEEAEKKYNAQKTSEFEVIRAKTNVANAIPDVYNAESSVILALWQLKAVLGVDLDENIDVTGSLLDYSEDMSYDIGLTDSVSLDHNTSMRQLAIQAEQLAESIKLQKYAYIPTLSAAFSFSFNAMANDFKFDQYRWTPYSYVGLSLSIPIFSGGKRYNDVRHTKTQYEQLKLQTMDTERNLKISIRQSLTTMETNMKSYYAAKEAVVSAQKGYDIAEKTYQVGRSTLIELNDAQLALTQAKLGVSQAVYNFVTAKAQLEQTLGRDFLEDNDN